MSRLETWVLIVPPLTYRWAASSGLLIPVASSRSTSTSRVDEFLGWRVLEQEPAGAGAQRLEHVVVPLEGGEDDDPAGDAGLGDDAAGGLQPRRSWASGRP
jgi:hypothetical protein